MEHSPNCVVQEVDRRTVRRNQPSTMQGEPMNVLTNIPGRAARRVGVVVVILSLFVSFSGQPERKMRR